MGCVQEQLEWMNERMEERKKFVNGQKSVGKRDCMRYTGLGLGIVMQTPNVF